MSREALEQLGANPLRHATVIHGDEHGGLLLAIAERQSLRADALLDALELGAAPPVAVQSNGIIGREVHLRHADRERVPHLPRSARTANKHSEDEGAREMKESAAEHGASVGGWSLNCQRMERQVRPKAGLKPPQSRRFAKPKRW